MPLPDAGPGLPESRFVVADVLLRFDHLLGVAEVLAGPTDLQLATPGPDPGHGSNTGQETQRFPDAETYMRGVERCKEHIRRGDAFQIVLSQRAEKRTDVGAVALYRALRRVNPSPYLFLLELDGIALVGSSPETLVKREGQRASVNPIAGLDEPRRRRRRAAARVRRRTARSTSCSSTSDATTCRASASRGR